MEFLAPRRMRARGVDTDLQVEAESLSALERRVRQESLRELGSRRPPELLVGGFWAPVPPRKG